MPTYHYALGSDGLGEAMRYGEAEETSRGLWQTVVCVKTTLDTFTCAKVKRHGSPLSLEYVKMQEAAQRGETLNYLHI